MNREQKIKVLIGVGGFYPGTNFGGPVTSLINMCMALQDKIDFFIVTLNHDYNSNEKYKTVENGWNYYSYASVLYLNDAEINKSTLSNIVHTIKPDVLLTNNFFLAKFTIPFLMIAKQNKLPIVIAPRGEFYPNAFNKKYKKMPYIWFTKAILFGPNTFFLATNEDEKSQFISYLADSKKIFVIPNLATQYSADRLHKFEKNSLKLIYVARIHESKNLLFALRCLKKIKLPVEYSIYGTIEDKNYWVECQKAINDLPVNIKVKYEGTIDHDKLESVYCESDALFLPTLTENFGHSIAEALLCGTPVIIGDHTPWNWINEKNCGYAGDLSREDEFVKALNHLAKLSDEKKEEISSICIKEAKAFLEIDETKDKYLKMFLQLKNLEMKKNFETVV